MKIVMAQINTLVGDIKGNTQRILDVCVDQSALGVDMVVFPELTLTGYPPEDLLLRQHTTDLTAAALERLCQDLPDGLAVVVGYPRRQGGLLFNSAGVLYNGAVVAEYDKQCLPNYQVFDEKRYFEAGADTCVVTIKDLPIGLTICEDIWHPHPAANAAAAGAQLLINLNASPFHRGKQSERTAQVSALARTHQLPILYVNQVGGQDELVFDGGSFVVDARGDVQHRAIEFAEVMLSVEIETSPQLRVAAGAVATPLDELDAVWQALVLGMRDYVNKNGFPGVVLGLSGGIDSAVTLAVAVDALGPERVEAVMMPFRYTASMSIEDAAEQANTQGVAFSNRSIEPLYEAFMTTLGSRI
jgi:NAD+ synthase (glutamine-hydrolysing)